LVRVVRGRGADDLLALLDTGFDGEIYCNQSDAIALGVRLSGGVERVELAGGVKATVQRGELEITWMGRVHTACALISGIQRTKPAADGEPAALIGSSLLRPHLVLLDYSAMTIEIEEQ
jgi:predicted aspartyl protease